MRPNKKTNEMMSHDRPPDQDHLRRNARPALAAAASIAQATAARAQ